MSETGDQTEAELEKTRRVVAESMAEQVAVNDAAASEGVDTEEDDDDEDDLEQLRADAEAAGVTVDRRWGVDRLRTEIANAKEG